MTSESKPAEPSWDELKPQIIKMALELGPLVVFFIVNTKGEDILAAWPALTQWFTQPIIFATAVFMVAMIVSLALSWLLLRRIAVMPLVTGLVVLVFGRLTLYFQDATFIKLKPTIVNTLFAVILGGGLVLFKKPLLKPLFGAAFKLTDEGWYQLTMRWTVFFFVLAIVNEVMWRNFPTDTWIASKMFLSFPLTMVFAFLQIPLLKKYWDGDDNPFARGS